MIQPEKRHEFSLDAGVICLDFANTLEGRRDPEPQEHLPDYNALLDFATASNLIDLTVADQLRDLSARRPHDARAIHAAAQGFREAVFRVSIGLVNGNDIDSHDLQVIDRSLASALSHGGLERAGDYFSWNWRREQLHLGRPLWPIAADAFRFLTQEDLSRLRVCAADDCDWLFLDESRNRSRKWCDMNTCGNRAKVARYRIREKVKENSKHQFTSL